MAIRKLWFFMALCLATVLTPSLLLAQDDSSVAASLPEPATASSSTSVSSGQAIILGLVEGITEYLPVSSTGHLVIASEFLGLRDHEQRSPEQIEAIEAYEIVIQAGAILAVLWLYMNRVKHMLAGLLGRDEEGRRLLIRVMVAFSPAVVLGLLLNKIIKTYLQFTGPVVFAMILGGLVMVLFERSRWRQPPDPALAGLKDMSVTSALIIGLAQCLAMWPGTSRSMVTIMAGRMRGLNVVAAAEFSFLLGLPTLLAATCYKLLKDGKVLFAHVGPSPMLIGLVVAAVSAAIAVKGFVAYLTRHGLAPFGWYRVAFGIFMLAYLGSTAL